MGNLDNLAIGVGYWRWLLVLAIGVGYWRWLLVLAIGVGYWRWFVSKVTKTGAIHPTPRYPTPRHNM